MKLLKFFSLTILLVAGIAVAVSERGQADMHEGPGQAIDALAVAMKARDGEMLNALLSPSLVLRRVAVEETDAGPSLRTRDTFIQDILTSEAVLDERISILSVSRDGPVAQAWTSYVFYADGTLSHCGHNAFTLVERVGRWQVTDITYTVHQDGCEEMARQMD